MVAILEWYSEGMEGVSLELCGTAGGTELHNELKQREAKVLRFKNITTTN